MFYIGFTCVIVTCNKASIRKGETDVIRLSFDNWSETKASLIIRRKVSLYPLWMMNSLDVEDHKRQSSSLWL